MFEIGDTLREARLRAGLTLKDAEDRTKIRAKYLQALENDDFSVIPGPTFVKGFLRTYAGFLGLDGGLLVGEYRSRFEPQQEQQVLLRPSSTRVSGGPSVRFGTVAVAVVAVAVILALAWVGWGNRDRTPAEIKSSNAVEPATTTTTARSTTSVRPAAGAGGAATTTTTTVRTGAVEFQIEAVRDRCWVIVRDGSGSGKVLYSGTLEQGQKFTHQVAKAAWLTIGNPSVVRLIANGKTVPVPDPYGAFVLTAAGLKRLP